MRWEIWVYRNIFYFIDKRAKSDLFFLYAKGVTQIHGTISTMNSLPYLIHLPTSNFQSSGTSIPRHSGLFHLNGRYPKLH